MFKITRKNAHRVDIEFSGKLDSEDMRTMLDELIDKTKDTENGRMLYRIGDFKFPTLGAMAIEFSRLPQLFKLIGKFERAAVLVDQQWLKKASEIEGALIPGLEIKAFDRDETAAAEAWLAG